jgi:excisionase family DNA binding protein
MPLTTKQAAEVLGCTDSAVKKMIARGVLPASKFGRDWMIEESDLAGVESINFGRPRNGRRLTEEDKARIRGIVHEVMER